jgi:hypothetical protein
MIVRLAALAGPRPDPAGLTRVAEFSITQQVTIALAHLPLAQQLVEVGDRRNWHDLPLPDPGGTQVWLGKLDDGFVAHSRSPARLPGTPVPTG